MRVATLTIKGSNEWNEDALVLNEPLKLYGVLDGSTSLQPYRGANGETGGYLASQVMKQYFEQLTAEQIGDAADGSLLPIVLEANRLLRAAMQEAGIDTSRKEALWTSALALIRITDRCIDYAQVGDCMIMAQYADGGVRVITRDQVAHMDKNSKKIREQAVREGAVTREELWERMKPSLLHNRTLMNTSEGYSVMSGEPEVADFVEYGRIIRTRLKSLLLVTDGLFIPAESSTDGSPQVGGRHADAFAELMVRIGQSSLSDYAEALVRLEQEDKECRRYPRFKVSDDKTAILIHFD